MYKHKENAIRSMNNLYIPGSAQATEQDRQIEQLKTWYRETRERIEASFKVEASADAPTTPDSEPVSEEVEHGT
jgi:hypothetical protein